MNICHGLGVVLLGVCLSFFRSLLSFLMLPAWLKRVPIRVEEEGYGLSGACAELCSPAETSKLTLFVGGHGQSYLFNVF